MMTESHGRSFRFHVPSFVLAIIATGAAGWVLRVFGIGGAPNAR